MSDSVSNNAAQHRFELEVDGHIAAAYYERSGDVVTFEHTEVPAELGGKGIGSKLIKGALDQVRAEGLKVVAQCPFVKADYASRLCGSLKGDFHCAAPSRCTLSRAVYIRRSSSASENPRSRLLLSPSRNLACRGCSRIDIGGIILQRLCSRRARL